MELLIKFSDFFEEFPHKFGAWNAGCVFYNNKWLFTCRNETSRYNQDYFKRKVPKEFRWERSVPTFIEFSENLDLLSAITGNSCDGTIYEDIRPFSMINNIFLTGTCKSENSVDQFLAVKSGNNILRLPFKHDFKLRQKNWAPIIWENKLYFEQFPGPVRQLVEYDFKGNVIPLKTYHVKMRPLRGNSPTFWLNERLFSFYHYHVNRNYFHVLAELEANPPFNIKKIGKDFKFPIGKEKIQFLMGAVPKDEYLYLSYGVMDADNYFTRLKVSEVLKLL